jgi:hypothetical protein
MRLKIYLIVAGICLATLVVNNILPGKITEYSMRENINVFAAIIFLLATCFRGLNWISNQSPTYGNDPWEDDDSWDY